ncbi:uncharacterized protein LOC129975441 [Argiope bruennichi]|uniref:uncharacterized protein LOC129975441 n=1 Tax=Argiope bruennichi TaxID=94029 RepID=UPI002494F633|nr:uncharacterized protein LOC129975441 [Argiope bruennichi]
MREKTRDSHRPDSDGMADEGIELRSPFPVVPPLKDSKWNDLPTSADGESRPVEPPKLLPDIGETHPCPYFVGRELNFIKPREEREKKKKEVSPPIIVPPVTVPLVQPPIETLAQPLIEKSPEIPRNTEKEISTFESFLDECLHGIAWECVTQHSRDLSREMFCALISSNAKKFILDKETLNVLRKKLFKKNSDPNWSEPCEPIDRLKFDVLSCQAYKLTKARYTLSNEAISEFHRRTVAQSISEKLMDLYNNDMEKKLKKQDSKELKQNPPRVASFITI